MTLQASLRDGTTDGNGLADAIETFDYRNGPLRFSYAYQQTHGDGALRANLAGVSFVYGPVTSYLSFFNGDGGTPRYHNDGASVSTMYAVTSRFRASLQFIRIFATAPAATTTPTSSARPANAICRRRCCSMQARAGCAIAATRPSRCAA
ncbi:Outer membrane protein (porin) [Candidatus Burkholderia brachyanthoides]|nr:Outer membrane protein (porin) [Candidatus Burkholderia brachyanthoides]